jgi:hypothetical protein
MIKEYKDIYWIQIFFTLIILISIVENMIYLFLYIESNFYGMLPPLIDTVSVLVTLIRKIFSRQLILIISMGYGITK